MTMHHRVRSLISGATSQGKMSPEPRLVLAVNALLSFDTRPCRYIASGRL